MATRAWPESQPAHCCTWDQVLRTASRICTTPRARKRRSSTSSASMRRSISAMTLPSPPTLRQSRPYSKWLRTSRAASELGRDAAEAIVAARTAPGQIATFIVPADVAWSEGAGCCQSPCRAQGPGPCDWSHRTLGRHAPVWSANCDTPFRRCTPRQGPGGRWTNCLSHEC